MGSLKLALLKWTLGTLSVGSLVLVLVAYLFTLGEMDEVLDENLREVATAVAQYHSGSVSTPASIDRSGENPVFDSGELVTRIWRSDGAPIFSSNVQVPIPFTNVVGTGTSMVNGFEWKTYTLVDHGLVVQAAQRTMARKQMAGEAAAKLLVPLLLLISVIGAFLVMALRRGLQPLESTAAHMARRTASTLEPLRNVDVPRELEPLVNAFNGLMERLAAAFATQRRFVADAAHELRTPITALRLQLRLLEGSVETENQREACAELRSGIGRMERLVEQLLQLSRSEPDEGVPRRDEVSLDELVRAVVADFSGMAQQKSIDLGACADVPVLLLGDEEQLRVMLNNLVRNALAYCRPGSKVDVTASTRLGVAVVEVVDDGPGIDPSEQTRVFDRFYRGAHRSVRESDPAGSGLGLAIVKSIAERHHASVVLGAREGGGGLAVSVTFAALR